ncbi:hypothetical protein BDZ88DRAFT_509493 [Geranomyces variabilis]|nr:hypothetical protein BDZ88DRAFT_509493 [Geranomyces variabilis]KAJ3136110.1 hypothetical protein HDU90_003513 [Geranomyces variabilis]
MTVSPPDKSSHNEEPSSEKRHPPLGKYRSVAKDAKEDYFSCEDTSTRTTHANNKPKSVSEIYRHAVCPFLVNVHVQHGQNFFSYEDSEIFHTWKNATLRELASLIATRIPLAKKCDVAITFTLLTFKPTANDRLRFLGTVHNFRPSRADSLTLNDAGFEIGDDLLVSMLRNEKFREPVDEKAVFVSLGGGEANRAQKKDRLVQPMAGMPRARPASPTCYEVRERDTWGGRSATFHHRREPRAQHYHDPPPAAFRRGGGSRLPCTQALRFVPNDWNSQAKLGPSI